MTAEQLRAGKLEQVCPACGIREAAGSYCSACVTRTGPDYWRLTQRSDAQRAASRVSGHSRGVRGVVTEKTATPGLVAYPIKSLRAGSGVVSPTAPTPHAGAVGVETTPDARRRVSGQLSG